jgi:hypothetical protein
MADLSIFSHLSSVRKDQKAIYCITSYFLCSRMARRHANILQMGDEEKWLDLFVGQNDLFAKIS